jgi:hypothetical protein
MAGSSTSDLFGRSMQAAITLARSSDAPDRLGADKVLLRDVTLLARRSEELVATDYIWEHEKDRIGSWRTKDDAGFALYEQLHSTVGIAVHLVRAKHGFDDGESIDALRATASTSPALRTAVLAMDRDLRLLAYLCTVRNKTVKHRGPAGQTVPMMIVHPDGFAILGSLPTVNIADAKRARKMLDGTCRAVGVAMNPGSSEELLFYLELLAHQIRPSDPSRSAAIFKLIYDIRPYFLVVSKAMLDNVDRALASLIDLAQIDPATP